MPIYRQAFLTRNALALYLMQSYKDKFLLMCDDSGECSEQSGNGWLLHTTTKDFANLPQKYNYMSEMAFTDFEADALVVIENDDIYFPRYLEYHSLALAKSDFSKPSKINSISGSDLVQEGSLGRFHSSLAFTKEGLQQVGGWPDTNRGDFDLQFISQLTNIVGVPSDPCNYGNPQFVYGWGTGSIHVSGLGNAEECRIQTAREAIASVEGPVVPNSVVIHPEFMKQSLGILSNNWMLW